MVSPVLYKDIVKWFENKIQKQAEVKKIKTSILKYLTSLSGRPTPFETFLRIFQDIINNENYYSTAIKNSNQKPTLLH